ncbi:MAG TPA: right-handed parallel beta-helix repeat-containing protein, partial [Candidatus Eisenbacteria bacterium]|nr:right-handed parallel beta-helix repeat-containing protein [Candidatus Eisenbacteria bacterium]
STIDGNVAVQAGGLSAVGAGLMLAVANSTISNNRAVGNPGTGGGMLIGAGFPSTLTNVTVSGNAAESSGGGIQAFGNLTFRNLTFGDNAAPTGSQIFSDTGPLTLTSSILSGAAGGHCAGTALPVSGDFNIDSDGSCGLAGPNDRTVDPQLGPLADNGGPTFTHLPAAASAAIDGGNPVECPATDQRGQVRPTDGNGDGTVVCDIGAVEFLDLCPTDPAKVIPGTCGCGVPDVDVALPNGVADCLVNGELKARIERARTILRALTGDASDKALETELINLVGGFAAYVKQFKAQLVLVDPKAKLDKLAKKTKKPVKKVTKAKAGKKLDKAKAKATTALDNLDRAVAPQ